MKLTQKEGEVLLLLCADKTTAYIAEELGIGVRTVDIFRRDLLRKAGARGLAGLIVNALRLKWIELDNHGNVQLNHLHRVKEG